MDLGSLLPSRVSCPRVVESEALLISIAGSAKSKYSETEYLGQFKLPFHMSLVICS